MAGGVGVAGRGRGMRTGVGAMEAFGAMVKRQRQARRWSQERLAAEAGGQITQSAVSQVELGKGRPQPATVRLLARALEEDELHWLRQLGYAPADDAALAAPAPGDPLEDVFRWLREDPEVVAGFLAARRDLKPEVYARFTRVLAAMWKANQHGQYETWRMLQGLGPEPPGDDDPGDDDDAGDAA